MMRPHIETNHCCRHHTFACVSVRFVFIGVFLIASTNYAVAQTINLSDSLKNVLKEKPAPALRVDTRNSFVTGRSVRVYGLKAGISFRKTLTIGIGFNWMDKSIEQQVLDNGKLRNNTLRMQFVAPFIEYSFYKKGPWEATIPAQLGFGTSYWRDKRTNDKLMKSNIIMYEPMMTVEYKILNTIAFGGGLGYRIMLKNNKQMDQQFTSPVYVLRARIMFEEIWQRMQNSGNPEE